MRRRPRRLRSRGLSPPTRGSLLSASLSLALDRSIPAHAGEPSCGSRSPARTGVYPRPRGGASGANFSHVTDSGLSPPTRGSPGVIVGRIPSGRSIPAHAGEPAGLWSAVRSTTVYPRPRGGASSNVVTSRVRCGLSPPTRGSLNRAVCNLYKQRSIPAHAGEPAGWSSIRRCETVYPRPRGGAASSPAHARGSIPAHAGEVVVACAQLEIRGLSPPTRGTDSRRGSIPAHAGEPLAA